MRIKYPYTITDSVSIEHVRRTRTFEYIQFSCVQKRNKFDSETITNIVETVKLNNGLWLFDLGRI